jgi:type VI secretion system secreted protein Hcp
MRFQQITKILAPPATVAALGASPVAIAAVDMFLKLDHIGGESIVEGHAGEIDILAWSWGESRTPDCIAVQDLSFTHFIDKASPRLIENVPTGQPLIPNAKLTVRKAGANPMEYIVINMSNVTVSSVSTGGSGGEDRLTENVTLKFAALKFTYTTPTGEPVEGNTAPAGNCKK